MDHALLLLDLLWENYDKDANPSWTLLEEAIQNLPSSCHGQRALMEEKTSRPDGAFTWLKKYALRTHTPFQGHFLKWSRIDCFPPVTH